MLLCGDEYVVLSNEGDVFWGLSQSFSQNLIIDICKF